jgi:peptide/nickel transport system permease protein
LIGLVSAWMRGSWLDSALPPIFVITSAFPYFWDGLLLVYFFSIRLGVFPSSDAYNFLSDSPALNWHYIGDVLRHAVLPAMTILITAIGGWILTMRNNMITVMADDYVRMARAKGLKPWRIMWKYAGKNAVLPNLTGFAMSVGFVVSGAIVVEYVFNYPGVGTLLLTAVSGLDYPLMQALFLLITLAVLLSVLGADIVTAIVDPRTRDPG